MKPWLWIHVHVIKSDLLFTVFSVNISDDDDDDDDRLPCQSTPIPSLHNPGTVYEGH